MQVELFNRQRVVTVDLARLNAFANHAIPECIAQIGGGQAVLERLESVEISVVSDRTIAEIHKRFLGVPGATDVITFEHGEIIVSATTAARQAVVEHEILDRELARYIVHGLLHLNGHLDDDPADAAEMWRVQESVLRSVWPKE